MNEKEMEVTKELLKETEDNMPVFDFDDLVKYIAENCDISRDVIETVLELEEEYMSMRFGGDDDPGEDEGI